jgi:hypothetical protein
LASGAVQGGSLTAGSKPGNIPGNERG